MRTVASGAIVLLICASVAGFMPWSSAVVRLLGSDLGAANSKTCRPSYLLLENSSEALSTQADSTTLAIVGCEETLEQVSDRQLAEIEELLRARSRKARWSGLITEAEREWARRRITDVLGRSAKLDVFYYSSPD